MGQRSQTFIITEDRPYSGSPTLEIHAYHHGWLYGASFVNTALYFMQMSKKLKYEHSPHRGRLHGKGVRGKMFEQILSLIKRGAVKPRLQWENWLNVTDEYDADSFNYTEGDNNDGVLIIDIRNPDKPKYCFTRHPYDLTFHRPETWDEYYKHYYPDMTISDFNEVQNKKYIDSLTKSFSRFPVLTQEELADIFPTMFLRKLKEEND